MSNETRRILLVEDEKAIRDAVTAYLERENYWVTAVGDGQDALEEFQKHHFDLVILDLMLPRVPGERVCRVIRDTSDVPIIMLTAKGEVEDRIIGLELGADDYLVKPFSPRELVARSRALLRRVHADSEPQREVLEFGELTIDVSGHKVLVSGEEIDLTASEFKLLTTLSRYPGRVYSRMELVEKVLPGTYEICNAFVRFYFCFLFPHQTSERTEGSTFYEKYIREEYNDFQLLTYRRICQEVLQGRFRTVELWNSRQGKIYFLCREDTGRKIVVDYSGTVCYTSKDYDVLQASMKREHVTADSILIFSENGYEKTLTEGTVQILVHSVDENS